MKFIHNREDWELVIIGAVVLALVALAIYAFTK